ncbi:MAG: ArnT family glycosyltransferase [Planctomycetaceae bacterium]
MESRWFARFCWSALLIYGGLFVFLCVQHVMYPGFLELMEADTLQQISRIAEGKPAYPQPDGEFIALAYNPLYYFVSAPTLTLFGGGFMGPRLVSVLCALAAGGIVGWIACRESQSRSVGVLAAALYFASYRLMDAWLTCALPDAMLLVWVLLGYCGLAYGRTRWHDVAWLLCFTLAFWTKQHGAFFFGFAVLYALLFRQNALPRWGLVLGILLGGPVSYFGIGQFLGDGFFQQTFVVPGHWERSIWYSARRVVFVLVEFVPFALLLTLCYLRDCGATLRVAIQDAERRATLRLRRTTVSPLTWFTVTTFAAIAFTMMVAGSSNNHFIPLIAILCVTASLGVAKLFRSELRPQIGWELAVIVVISSSVTWLSLRQFGHHAIPVFVPFVAGVVLLVYFALTKALPAGALHSASVALLLVVGQFGSAAYNLPDYLPKPGFLTGLARLRGELDRVDAPVIWIPYGSCPSGLLGRAMLSAPSIVALEDMTRQQNVAGTPEERVAAFHQRIRELPRLYVLSNQRIEDSVVWNSVPVEWELVRDYGREFSNVQQITRHWFGGGEYPRFLYRKRGEGMTKAAQGSGVRISDFAAGDLENGKVVDGEI